MVTRGPLKWLQASTILFAYDATTDLIADYQYEQVCDALIFETGNQEFMRNNNPAALEEMAERMLEACQRGMWHEPGEHQKALQDLLLDLDQQKETAVMTQPTSTWRMGPRTLLVVQGTRTALAAEGRAPSWFRAPHLMQGRVY